MQTPDRFLAEGSNLFVHHISRLGKNSWEKNWGGWVKPLVFASDRPVSSPNFTVSFSKSWLRVCFKPGTFLGMRNTVDKGQRRSLPSWSLHLSAEAKRKPMFRY